MAGEIKLKAINQGLVFRGVLVACLLLPVTYALALAGATGGQIQSGNKKNENQTRTATAPSDGERRFHENCGRCHNPPEDLSPREAKAVIRQMRVRAMLSAEDEKAILQYLAP